MTNNEELAMQARADFESWWEVHYHNGNPPRFGWAAYREDGGYKIDDDEPELDAMWNAWQAAQSSLLAERDADKKRIAELEARTVSVKLPDNMPPEAAPAHYWVSGESMAYADGYNKSTVDLKNSFIEALSSVGLIVEFE